ncbi:MAG: glycosyltransferase family 2 protein [Alphaproteobacteria bacterium]|jgi:glycosyltransferase involved in cell wall biosynthesis|nr:glycosyltransferase family 2 protein [Alphaproteobacteria bacterium]MBT5390529.1 glycosyltransferase family 2 protein [Alphaproteobacteria bacterium]MBT5540995.1 glycosyltransferase family 2 protein [Alphaproteobacteria bacterium]MBT5654799.1 glycosyltransferase family 2 protein [Alphaproteobacteria bacterium]
MTSTNRKKTGPKVSVIVTTYNWPKALDCVLHALQNQDYDNYEVIVADDGSKPETKSLIDRYKALPHFNLKHYWQEDVGFRVSKARNGAFNTSTGDYIIFTDGDCIPLPNFIRKHVEYSEAGYFTTGRRSYIRKPMTQRIFKNGFHIETWGRSVWFLLSLCAQANRPFQFLPLLQSRSSRSAYQDKWERAQTCNLGVSRKDFISVGGFDERYEGYGQEDSDFVIRLLRSGIKRINMEYVGPVLHLYHSRKQSYTGPNKNADYFSETFSGSNTMAKKTSVG